MAYKYKKIRKKISVGKTPGEKYLAAISVEGRVKNEELIRYIEENSSISEADITILFEALATLINENISSGRGVNLSGLGVFSPNIRTKGNENVDEVSAKDITKVVVNFRPCTKFREAMKNAPVSETNIFNIQHVSKQ